MGGNLVDEISLFGDFLHQQMRRFYPQYVEPIAPKPQTGERRLRIGYISSNFCHQAVSYYMANRIFFADKQRFEVQVFALEKRFDTMTDHIKAHSDRFVVFNDLRNLACNGRIHKKERTGYIDLCRYWHGADYLPTWRHATGTGAMRFGLDMA